MLVARLFVLGPSILRLLRQAEREKTPEQAEVQETRLKMRT